MVTKEHCTNCVIQYIESDVLPKLPTSAKWLVGTGLILGKERISCIADTLVKHPLVKTLGIVDEYGMVDADKLCKALKESADRYGAVEIVLPIVGGNVKFNGEDIEKLRMKMVGGAT